MVEPDEFFVSETLKNGVVVTIRALRASDRDKIASAVRLPRPRVDLYPPVFATGRS